MSKSSTPCTVDAGPQLLRPLALLCAIAIVALPAAARDNTWQQREDNTAWRSECSACHIAFPPALLSADDWLVIMSELDRHFGTNASLDAKTRQEISAFLEHNAAANRQFGSREETPRITGTDWFVRKHQGAIRLWRKGRVKSLADCAACHKGPDIEKMTGN
jgi:hypothetical protein